MQPTSSRKRWGWRRIDRLDNILFLCCVRAVISTEVQVLRYVATQLWAFTALHPSAVGWPITFLTQPGRAENWVVPGALLSTTGQEEREPSSFSLLQANGPERKEGKKKVPPGRVCCSHRAGTPEWCWIIIHVMFLSLLYSQGAAALGWAASCLLQGPLPLHQEKLCHLVKQTRESDAVVTGFQCWFRIIKHRSHFLHTISDSAFYSCRAAARVLPVKSAINSPGLAEKSNMPSVWHLPRFSAHCQHFDWWCCSLMWDDCQLFLNKYKKKQRNPHPFQARVNYFLFSFAEFRHVTVHCPQNIPEL